MNDPYSYEKLILFLEINSIELPTLTQTIPRGRIIFRSRENNEIDFFEKIDDLGCPPKNCITTFNRANRPCQSMFYCSDKRETSYSEFVEGWREKSCGSIFNITVSAWETLKNLNVHLIFDRRTLEKDFNSEKGEDWDDDHFLINDFLVDIYKKSAHNNKLIYILTSAISNILLLRSKLDGIMYPCVPTNGNGLNLVLRSNICDRDYLKILHVTRDTFITTKNENKLKANQVNFSSVDGKIDFAKGSIIWE